MIAVTGALGFIGNNLLRRLLERGVDVLAVDEPEPVAARRHLDDLPSVRVVDRQTFADWIDADSPELAGLTAVLHQGACSSTTETRQDYLDTVNVGDTLRIIRYCQRRELPLVYASSAAVYGAKTGFREDPACEGPINLYAESKKRVDDWVRAELLPTPAAPIVGLRYFNVYGPRESHKGAMASVAYKMHGQLRRTDEVTLFGASHGYGDGGQSRDFVYVDDVVSAALWFLDHPEISGIFNVGTGRAEPFNAIAQAVLAQAGRGSLRYVPFPDSLRDQYQAWTEADLTQLRAAGYPGAFRPVAEGVRAYMDWLDRVE